MLHGNDKPRHTWQAATARWLDEQSHKRSLRDDVRHIGWLKPHFDGKFLDEIDRDAVDSIKALKRATGVSNASVNRLLALIRAILNRARDEWQWLCTAPKVRLLPEATNRIRWLTHVEAIRLLNELPEHLEAMARFTLATGLRESNVTGLQWSQVDIARRCAWIHADQSKSNKTIAVPLNADAIQILNAQKGKHRMHVFTYQGAPIVNANTKAFRGALVRAGIENFRWHDLRHTWASWHIQNGTPTEVLKELGGWSDIKMALRYAHLSSSHLLSYADAVRLG